MLVIGFIGLIQIVTTRNYRAIANSHTLKFTTAFTKSSQFAVSSPVVAWWRKSTCSLLPCSHFYRLAIVSQVTHCSKCPAYNISAQSAQKHRSSVSVYIVAFASVWMPTWSLLSYCLATAVVYRTTTKQMLYNCLSRCPCLAVDLRGTCHNIIPVNEAARQ
jgi:hypothetical protein